MHHHGAGPGAEGLELRIRRRVAGAIGQKPAEQNTRRNIGDHRFRRHHLRAIGQHNAVSGTGARENFGHRRIEVNIATEFREVAGHRP